MCVSESVGSHGAVRRRGLTASGCETVASEGKLGWEAGGRERPGWEDPARGTRRPKVHNLLVVQRLVERPLRSTEGGAHRTRSTAQRQRVVALASPWRTEEAEQ